MELEFEVSEVTQELEWSRQKDSGYYILQDGRGKGYKKSLQRGYLKEVRDFLEQERGNPNPEGKRVLLLAPDAELARQAYLVLRKGLLETAAEEDEGENSYSAYYGRMLSGSAGEKRVGEVLVVPEKKRTEENYAEKEMVPSVRFIPLLEPVFMGKDGDNPQGELEKAETVFVELGLVKEGDATAERVLALGNSWAAVYLKPSGSYEYVLKRLVFEGGYRVIAVGKPSRQDYLEYAGEYLKYHHFSADPEDLQNMLQALLGYRGAQMTEKDIYLHLNRCMKKALREGKRKLSGREIAVNYEKGKRSAKEEFDRVVGLDDIKEVLWRRLAAKQLMLEKNISLHGNYILEGPPGTGKSKMARLLARLMGELGISNGRFEDVSRADIIGQYVGHTAVKIQEVFGRADGGVIFVDEASFLLGTDQYVKEAVIEFVRYMELNPQTTVLFATYPKEGERLLMCDSGFQSRIHQILTFSEYTEEELFQIFQGMAQDYGFELETGCKEVLTVYIETIRSSKNFGNAREVRRLLETSIEEYGLRGARTEALRLSVEDVERAARYLQAEAGKTKEAYGFLL